MGWFGTEREQAIEAPELPVCAFLNPYLQERTHPLFPIAAPDITRGVACGRFNNGEAKAAEDLPQDIVAALRDAPWQLMEEPQPWIDHRGLLVVGNQHGELLTVFRTPAGRLWIPQQGLIWTPDPVTAERLKDLFAEFGNGVISSHPCQNIPYSRDVDDGDIFVAHICGDFTWVRTKIPARASYTLPDGLTQRIAEAFPAQAVP